MRLRQLQQSPGLTIASVLTLATGIGAIVAMFSVYWRVVLDPVRVPDPGSLVSIYSVNHKVAFVPPALSWPRVATIKRGATVFSQMGAFSNESVTLGAADATPEDLRGLRVSDGFFETIGAVAVRGRLFTAADDVPNGPSVCVLSREVWLRRFGGRELVGSTIQLDGKSTEVVGVLAERMSQPWADRDIFLPRVFDDSQLTPQSVMNGATFLEAVARLRPGVTAAQAADNLRGLSRQYAAQFAGRTDAANEAEIRPFVETVVGPRRAAFTLLLAAVFVVLLVACTNAAALFLSRLASRQREIAVRQALGATRAVIVRGLLGESLMLAALAGIGGTALSAVMLNLIQATLGGALPPGLLLRIDGPALALAVGVVLCSALLVGLLPALHVTRPTPGSPLTTFARGMSDGLATRRFRGALVVVEVALSVWLLVGAGLFLASLHRLQQVAPGFDPGGLASAFTTLPSSRYATPERQATFFTEVVDRLAHRPGVTGAAVVFGLPFNNDNFATAYSIAGRPILPPSGRARAGLRIVTEDYFAVMRMRVVLGRGLSAADRAGSQGVCLVNESLARRQFGERPAIGQTILRGRNADQTATIVGIVADVRTNGLKSDSPDEIFYPFRQLPRPAAAIVARTSMHPEGLREAFQSAVSAGDPQLPISDFASMDQRMAATLGPDRTMAGLTAAFAAVALLLASVGLHAVLAHGVTSRTVEFGIRMAIGADRRAIARLVLGQGLRLVATGIVCGLTAAVLAARVLASHLYGVSPRDPLAYAVVAMVFVFVGAAASLAPALRAARTNPVECLSAR